MKFFLKFQHYRKKSTHHFFCQNYLYPISKLIQISMIFISLLALNQKVILHNHHLCFRDLIPFRYFALRFYYLVLIHFNYSYFMLESYLLLILYAFVTFFEDYLIFFCLNYVIFARIVRFVQFQFGQYFDQIFQ